MTPPPARSLLRRLVKAVLPHRKEHYHRMVFRRLGERQLRQALERLGVEPGMTIFVHSSLSALGYLPDGPEGVIRALIGAVGPTGTVAMPAFPFGGSMQDYVAERPEFDVRTTPSRVGALTELFRRWPGVVRSLHPTHSVCAVGQNAEQLVAGHELTGSPCGAASPFGKLGTVDARLLRLGTPSLTLFHHVQELLDFPNVFLPEPVDLTCRDASGRTVIVRTRVYQKGLPRTTFLGRDEGGQLWSVHSRDFPLLYSGERESLYRHDPRRRAVLDRLLAIRADFEARGLLRTADVNGARCELFAVGPYVDYAVREGRRLLGELGDRYDPAALRRMEEAGELPPG